MSRFYHIVAIATVCMLYTACDLTTHPEIRKTTLFSALETRTLDPIKLDDPKPILNAQEANTYKTIIDGFAKNASERLDDDQVNRHIERIDQIYIVTGRYLELVKIYEADYEKRGLDSRVVGRLAFAYVRLGQNEAARVIIDKMLEFAPNDPTAHFIDAMYWVRQPRTLETMGRALDASSTTLRIEPNYVGYEGINSSQLKQQIDQLRQVVPPNWKEQVEKRKNDRRNRPKTVRTGNGRSDSRSKFR